MYHIPFPYFLRAYVPSQVRLGSTISDPSLTDSNTHKPKTTARSAVTNRRSRPFSVQYRDAIWQDGDMKN